MPVRQIPRQVVVNSDETCSIPGESFITTDPSLATFVAKELDRVDPQYGEVEDSLHDIYRKRNSRRILSDLRVGESAWTQPWAVWQDRKRHWWLCPEYIAYDESGGTANMLVTRTKRGYEIRTPQSETWEPRKSPGYQSDSWIPVIKHRRL